MRNFYLPFLVIFLLFNNLNSQSLLHIGVNAGKQKVDIKQINYGTVSNKQSGFVEFSLKSSIELGHHAFIFGIGRRRQSTLIEYETIRRKGSFIGDVISVLLGSSPSSSTSSIYHVAERIELNNKYINIPIGVEFILNKSTEHGCFYLLPQINGNLITDNQRSFHITKNYDYLEKAKIVAEEFKKIPFKSFINCSLEFGGKLKHEMLYFGGGFKYQTGNQNAYGSFGGLKPVFSANIFIEYSFGQSKLIK